MLAERLTAQLLAGTPARDSLAVAERLLAIQGQDPRGARRAVRARTSGLHASDVDRALSDERTLLITWLNRGTLHLVRSEDYPLLHALTTPQLVTANARRLAQEGVPPAAAERGVEVVSRALAAEGPLANDQLRARLDAAGIRTQGQALVHILMLTCLRGLAVRGPVIEGKHRYALVRDWLGDVSPPPDRTRALAELARRFLVGHGPADDRDLAKWAGITLRDARAGLGEIAGSLVERGAGGLVDLAGREGDARPGEALPTRLLGPLTRRCSDGARAPTCSAWASRRSSSAGCSGRLPCRAAGPWLCGGSSAGRSSWTSRSRASPAPRPPHSSVTSGTSSATWAEGALGDRVHRRKGIAASFLHTVAFRRLGGTVVVPGRTGGREAQSTGGTSVTPQWR
jgi:hypothetical protein